MAWIESNQTLQRHPKTRRLAQMLDVSVPTAIGHLHCLWWWCLDFAEDGDLSDLEGEEIAEAAMWRPRPDQDMDAVEFMVAMMESGFLDAIPGKGYQIHNWDRYAGRLIETRDRKREQNVERQQRYRDKKNSNALRNASVTLRNAPTVPNLTVPNQTKPNQTKPVATTSLSGADEKSSGPGARWKFPDWWEPITRIDGYTRRKYTGTVTKLEARCKADGIDPAKLVKDFVDYYEKWSGYWGWIDPARTIVQARVLQNQIKSILDGTSPGLPPVGGRRNGRKQERIDPNLERF